MDQFDEVYDEGDEGGEGEDEDLPAEAGPVDVPAIPISPSTRSFLVHLMEDADTLPHTYRLDIGPLSFDFSMEDIQPGTREKAIQDLYERFNRFFLARLLQEIPEDQLELFADLLDSLDAAEDPNEIERCTEVVDTFLEQYIPYFQEVRSEIFFEFRHLYLDGVARSRSQQSTEQ